MTSAEALSAEDWKAKRWTFFALVAVATLFPYLFFPLKLHGLPADVDIETLTAVVLFLGANGHVGASFFFYDDREMRGFMLARGLARFLLLPLFFIASGALLFGLSNPSVRAYAVTAFWVWQVHHFTRQNNGILSFVAGGTGLKPSVAERAALSLTNVGAILGTLVFITPYRVTFLAGWGWQIYAVGFGCYLAGWGVYLFTLKDANRRTVSWRSLLMLMLMLFYLPLFITKDPFTAVYIFLTAHGLQYLVFMGYVARHSRLGAVRATAGTLVLCFGVGYGILLLQSRPFETPWGVTMLGAAYGVIIWHFLLDARVWRLRESFQREYMTRSFPFLKGPAT